MFGILVESNPGPQRRRGGVMASAAAHAAVFLLAVWATAEGSDRAPPPLTVDVLVPVFTQPARDAAPSMGVRRAQDAADAGPVARVPAAPTVPLIDVPTRLPPVEEAFGDPFADVARRSLVIGSRDFGDGAARGPVGLLENHRAEKPALPLEGNAPPRYPEALRAAGVQGDVEVEFVIEPSGWVRPGSVRELRADHPLFLQAVREALASHRFLPAEVQGAPVAVLVRQRFAFALHR